MKRKGDEDIDDGFPLSPAIKIRRLDGIFPTVIADEEQLGFKPTMVSVDNIASNTDPVKIPGEVMVELNPIQENDERAIVLFKPLATPLSQSPSSLHVSIDPDFLSEIKYNRLMSSQSHMKKLKEEEDDDEVSKHKTNQCLAVIPWMPSSQVPSTSSSHHQVEISELMMEEDDQMGEEAATMDIDEDSSFIGARETQMNENLNWQQQHWMIEQAQNSSSSPIVWFR